MQYDEPKGGPPHRRAHQRPSQAENRPVPGNHRHVRTLGGMGGEGRDPLPLPSRLRPVNRQQVARRPRTGPYVNCGPREPTGQRERESGSLKKSTSAEAAQKRNDRDRWGRVEGCNEVLILGSVRRRGYGFGPVVLAAQPSPGPRLNRLVRSSGHCSVLRYIRSSAGAGFQAWRP